MLLEKNILVLTLGVRKYKINFIYGQTNVYQLKNIIILKVK